MKVRDFVKVLLALLLVLALAACRSEMVPEDSTDRTTDLAQVEEELPEEDAPSVHDALEARLLQPLADKRFTGEGRKAFLADTRGRLGQLAVTIAFHEAEGTVRVEVWDPEDAQTPLQTITERADGSAYRVWADDINFDGHPDIHFDTGYFEYLYLLWDEDAGRFVPTDQLNGLRDPRFDQELQTVVDSDYWTTKIHQWTEGELTLMRRITVRNAREVEGLSALCRAEVYLPDYYPEEPSRYSLLTVEEPGYLGEMQVMYMEVMDAYHPTFEADCTFRFDPMWYDLQYDGRS